jgi:murein tripeptide amidase MpaA
MPTVDYSRFPRYDELTALLQAFAAEHPQLFTLQSIGRSHAGRDIWLLTATQRATGLAEHKPALWVDGNIHSVELTASLACLYFIDALAKGYGQDADITRALDTRVFYICPRINPDGAEWALADAPRYRRSSVRAYPFAEDAVDGLEMMDIDGDGRILTMRIADANGPWKKHSDDPRLMVKREPTETGGEYYRLLPEGRLRNVDGPPFAAPRFRESLDLNRNFPAGWRQEFEQVGAGDYPASEPEVRAVVDFIVKHPNVCAGTSFHSMSGVLLRPFSMHADEHMPPEDLWIYEKMGSEGTRMTGYPAIATYHEFRYHPKEVISGTFDWLYDHLGALEWTVELWSPMREAGIQDYDYIDWFRDHPPEDDVKLMHWNDTQLDGAGFVDWRPFAHPELGAVEIGGWHKLEAFNNPPPALREREIARFPRWLVWQALITPLLALRQTQVQALGPDTWRVRLVVQNTGWLPTSATKRAVERKVVRGVVGEIALPEGGRLLSGLARQEIGQLTGWSHQNTGHALWPDADPMGDIGRFEWIVQAAAGSTVTLTARHERAGRVVQELVLG